MNINDIIFVFKELPVKYQRPIFKSDMTEVSSRLGGRGHSYLKETGKASEKRSQKPSLEGRLGI